MQLPRHATHPALVLAAPHRTKASPVPFSKKPCCNRSEGSEVFRVGSRVLGDAMRRRDFIKAMAGMTAAWPIAARAQQAAMPVIGFLRSTSLADATHLVTAFRQGLKEADFVEGQNV